MPLPVKLQDVLEEMQMNEWSIMQRYAVSQPNPDHRDNLLNAIHGRGAFRLFKILLDKLNLRQEWFTSATSLSRGSPSTSSRLMTARFEPFPRLRYATCRPLYFREMDGPTL